MADASPIPMLLATAIPAAAVFAAGWVLPRVWTASDRRHALVIWVVAAVAASVALWLHGGFGLTGSATPLVMPGGLAAALLVLALAPAISWWRERDATPLAQIIAVLVLMAAVSLLSFPWWNRGAEGWLFLAVGTVAAVLLAGGVRVLGSGHHLGTTLSWAFLAGASAPLFISLTAIGHAQALAIIMTPVAAAAAAGLFGGVRVFEPRGLVLPAVAIAALLTNASIRYVPGYDDPEHIVWTLRLAPLALVPAVWLAAGLRRIGSPKLGIALAATGLVLVLGAAAAAATWAYSYEGEDDTSSGQAWDYGNYGR